jgi:hypothetical protein
MRWFLPVVVIALAACAEDESLTPTLHCAPTQNPSGWPAQAGVLSLDAKLPAEPFTPAPHRAFPTLVVPDAVVQSAPKIVTLIAADDPLADTLFAFADAAAGSAWWTAVAGEYGIGAPSRSVHVRTGAMPATPDGDALVRFVEDAVAAAGPDAAADGQTTYLIFLSPGVEAVYRTTQNCDCAFASGAHFPLSKTTRDALAWVQRCRATDVEGLTVTASHELIESATDPGVKGGYVLSAGKTPWKGTVWTAIQPGGDELGDWCEGTRVHEGAWEYQRSWSNLAALAGGDPCVPALAEPYYNVTTDQDWYPVQAGATVTVTLTGWASAPRPEWFVYPRLASAAQQGFSATITSDESANADGKLFYGLNNGKTATLTVTAPQAASGTYAVVRVVSRPGAPGADNLHFWPVGFYIP